MLVIFFMLLGFFSLSFLLWGNTEDCDWGDGLLLCLYILQLFLSNPYQTAILILFYSKTNQAKTIRLDLDC